MIFSPLARAITLATAGSMLLAIPSLASADFIKDSKANLGFRNLYMNQDTRPQPSGLSPPSLFSSIPCHATDN